MLSWGRQCCLWAPHEGPCVALQRRSGEPLRVPAFGASSFCDGTWTEADLPHRIYLYRGGRAQFNNGEERQRRYHVSFSREQDSHLISHAAMRGRVRLQCRGYSSIEQAAEARLRQPRRVRPRTVDGRTRASPFSYDYDYDYPRTSNAHAGGRAKIRIGALQPVRLPITPMTRT